MRFLFYFLLLLTLTACPEKDNDAVNCTEVFVYGLVIKVTDNDTNEIISKGITVLATEGDYTEELVFTSDRYVGAGERAGNYAITISGEGYTTVTINTVEVLADECHVITQELKIGLPPN